MKVHNFTRLTEIIGRDGHVAAVATDDGKQIPCDLVAVALGVMPQIGLAADAGLACKSGVLVDPYLRCSDPDIFAAGDLAEIRDPVADKGVIEVLWNSAVNKGRVAGRNMATEPVNPYRSRPAAQRHPPGRLEDHDHGHGRQRPRLRPGGRRPRRQ